MRVSILVVPCLAYAYSGNQLESPTKQPEGLFKQVEALQLLLVAFNPAVSRSLSGARVVATGSPSHKSVIGMSAMHKSLNPQVDDLWSILQVPRNATKEEITDSYRHLALKLHPSKNKSDTKQFERICAAADILTNDAKFSVYQQARTKLQTPDETEDEFLSRRVQQGSAWWSAQRTKRPEPTEEDKQRRLLAEKLTGSFTKALGLNIELPSHHWHDALELAERKKKVRRGKKRSGS